MKRRAKPILILALTGLLGTCPGWSQEQPAPAKPNNPASNMSQGQVTKGFTLPQYQDNKLTAMISGAEARVISVNRTEITGLKVELYEDGKVATTITSPKSDYWTADNQMRTRYGVEIDRNDMIITAQLMEWSIKTQSGVLRNNVKVVLNNLDLTKPAESPNPAATAPLSATPAASEPATAPSENSPFQLQQSPASTPSTLLPQ